MLPRLTFNPGLALTGFRTTQPGADPGFFLGGGAPLRNGVTDWGPDVNRF